MRNFNVDGVNVRPIKSFGLIESVGLDRGTLEGDSDSDYQWICEEFISPVFRPDGRGEKSNLRRRI